MNEIHAADLSMLAEHNETPHVSLYAPMIKSGPQTAQNPTRWEGLLARTEAALRADGQEPSKVDELLDPARQLLTDRLFWEYQRDGLVFFARPGWSRSLQVPLELPELAVVGGRFLLAPLLDLLRPGGRFLLLALNRRQVRLFEGSRFGLAEVPDANLPAAPECDPATRDRPAAFSAGRGRSAGTVFYARGDAARRREEILRYFRAVDAAVRRHAGPPAPPLILAGPGYLQPQYRQVSTYPNLLDDGLSGSPEQIPMEALHVETWPLVEPLARRDEHAARTRYWRLLGTGYTVAGPADVLVAAEAGRVEALFVATSALTRSAQADGPVLRLDPGALSVPDLLDRAAAACLAHGGDVYAVPTDRVPGHLTTAAVLRH